MNPPDAFHDEEQFTDLLARYHETLNENDDIELPADASLSPELRQRLRRALECLRRLRESSPRPPPAKEAATLVVAENLTEAGETILRQVGRFRILRMLGAGGGGIVFLALDPELRREVAVKIPRLDAMLTPQLRQRFLREARAAAALDHPHLVPVHEVGEANGLCFLVSAYCRGGSLSEWLKQRTAPVSIRQAAELLAVLADAVQYVHEHGIVHRDIKPGNILLDPSTVPPTGELRFTPRLADFGLAKLRDGQTILTESGAVLGTASYMAPEQIESRWGDIDPRTDVYGLGAVLYEMLAGRPPFRGMADADTLRQVLTDEPPSLRRARPNLPRDLETICLKCLEKQPSHRYASAAELADDLRRFLNHEPIRARPLGRLERLDKWVRRRPVRAILLVACFLAMLGLAIGELRLAGVRRGHEAERTAAAKQAEEQMLDLYDKEQRLRQFHYAEDIALAWRAWNDRRPQDMKEPLQRHQLAPGLDDLRGFEWHYLSRLADTAPPLMWHNDSLYCLAFAPDGATCASGHRDGAIVLWDTASGQRRGTLKGHALHVYDLAYSPDGQYLASASGAEEKGNRRGELLLWNATTQKLHHVFAEPSGAVNSLAFSPDGLTLAAAVNSESDDGNEVRMWEIPSGALLAAIPFAKSRGAASVAFSSDNATLLIGHNDGKISLYDAQRGRVLETWSGHDRCVWTAACGHKDDTFVSGGHDGKVRLCSLRSAGSLLAEYRHKNEIWSVALSSDDRSVASISRDIVKVWDRDKQEERFSVPFRQGRGRAVAFSPNGKTLAVGVDDGRLWFYDVFPSAQPLSWLGHRQGSEPREAWAVAFSPDSKTLASAGDDHAVRLWDTADGRELAALVGHGSLVTSLAFAPDGQFLASASFDRTIKLWDIGTGEELTTLRGHTERIDALAVSPDGRFLASSGRDRVARLWDTFTGEGQPILADHPISSLAFSPDGRTLALATMAQMVFLWDMQEQKVCRTLSPHPSGHVAVAFSPDGKTLASGDAKGTVRFWDAATGQLNLSIRHHTDAVNCLAFAPDGKTLASASFDKSVKLWQTATGRELLTLADHKDRVRWLAFSADGVQLATAGHDGVLQIYRASYLEAVPANRQR